MSPKTVMQLKSELLNKKNQLMNLQVLNKQAAVEDESLMKDVIDRSDSEEAWHAKERMSMHLKTELKQIDISLQRIEAGTFGDCEDCGVEIPVKRLRVRPDATLCLKCQEAFEKESAGTRGGHAGHLLH
jgi:DnaK suppressor protein